MPCVCGHSKDNRGHYQQVNFEVLSFIYENKLDNNNYFGTFEKVNFIILISYIYIYIYILQVIT